MKAEVLLDAIRPHVDVGDVPGAVVGVLRDGHASVEAAGTIAPGVRTPLAGYALMRISSNRGRCSSGTRSPAKHPSGGRLSLDPPVK